MTTRTLPVVEWPRLAKTLMATVWRQLDPAFAEVLVVERDGVIVGSVVLLSVLHAECLSVEASTSVKRALWRALRSRVTAIGGRAVWGAAVDPPMQRLLERHAEPIPGSHFLVTV